MIWSIVLLICQIVGFLSLFTYAVTLLSQSFLGFWEQNLARKYGAKWALVTGGSSGIGYAIVQKLASQGINTVIVAYPDRLLTGNCGCIDSRENGGPQASVSIG